jgi:nucleotide-binding universal stress UspA family protein
MARAEGGGGVQHDERIVVGYDGTGCGMAALEWAAREAADRGTPLHVISVAGYAGAPGGSLTSRHLPPSLTASAGDHLEEGLRMAAKILPEDLVTGEVATGHPAGVLVDASRQAQLVVVGQRSQGPTVSNAIGSTSVTLAGYTSSPVVLVRGASDARRHDSPVVVGATGHRDTDRALAFAAETACRRGVPLRIVAAWAMPAVGQWRYEPQGSGSAAAWARELAARADSAARDSEDFIRARWPDARVSAEVVCMQPWAALESASRRASLLVVGARGGGGFPGLGLGSVSRASLFRSGCPVAVVP